MSRYQTWEHKGGGGQHYGKQAKLLPAVLSSHIGTQVHVPTALLPFQLPAKCTWESSWGWPKHLGHSTHMDDLDGVQAPGFIWPHLGHCRHLENELVDRRNKRTVVFESIIFPQYFYTSIKIQLYTQPPVKYSSKSNLYGHRKERY